MKTKIPVIILIGACVACSLALVNQHNQIKSLEADLANVKADRYNVAYALNNVMASQNLGTVIIPFETSTDWRLNMVRQAGNWVITR